MFWLVEVGSFVDTWRLQEDGTWRQLGRDTRLQDGDQKFYEPTEADYYYSLTDARLSLGGRTVTINPSVADLSSFDHRYKTSARLVRTSRPKVPEMEQLRTVIMAGNDGVNNSLVLLVDGNFELVPLKHLPPRNARISVRYETFAAGNDYVGQRAAADDDFIRRTYTDMLALWLRHLRTGRLNIWDDTGASKRLEDILQAVELATASFK